MPLAQGLVSSLVGQDCYAEFKYAPLDLRPSLELEAYKAMEQSRMLELLSLGFYTDEEASVKLTGNLPPKGFKPLAGTGFYKPIVAPAGAVQAGTPASGTSALGAGSKQNTPAAPKAEGPNLEVLMASMHASHKDSLSAVADMAYTLSKSVQKPTEVTVAPSQVHLTLASDKKAEKTITIVKDEQGNFTAKVVEV